MPESAIEPPSNSARPTRSEMLTAEYTEAVARSLPAVDDVTAVVEPPSDCPSISRATSLYDRLPIGNRWRTPTGEIYAIVGWANGKVLVEQPGTDGCHWVRDTVALEWERIVKVGL
jgi:hypothetical protein